MSELPISDNDESAPINTGRPCVKTTGAENDVMQLNEKQLPGIVPAINHAQTASSNISEDLRSTIVHTCEICSHNTEVVSSHVAPIQASCESNHLCWNLENYRPQYQKVYSASANLPSKYEPQNANVNVFKNDRNHMSSSNTLMCENKNLRKRSFSQMNKSQNYENLILKDHHSPVRKKRVLDLKEFSENGSYVYQLKEQGNLRLKISPSSQNVGVLPTSESYGGLVPLNESENLNLSPSSQNQVVRNLPSNVPNGSFVPVSQSHSLTLTSNSQAQKGGILPTACYGSLLQVSGISYTNSLFEDNRIGIDWETSSPEMFNFKNAYRLSFKEKTESHHFSSISSFGNLRLEVKYRQKIVRSAYMSYHSQGAKENNVGKFYPQVPVNIKSGTGTQNWSAVNSDATKSCMDFIEDNSRQAFTLPTENANADEAEFHMDCADGNTIHAGELPTVNANLTKSCMEWIEEDSRQGSMLPAKNLDESELHMDWTDDNPYHVDWCPKMNTDMSNSCMDCIEYNSHEADLLSTVNTDNTAFGMNCIGNNSRRDAEFTSINLCEIATPMDWIDDKIESKKMSRKRKK